MATHELYFGGPASANIDRAVYPRPTFDSADWENIGVSAHKPYGVVVLNRTFDMADYAIADYFRKNPPASADVLNLEVIPSASLLLGVYLWVENPAGDATLAVRTGTTALGAAVDATEASRQLLVPGTTAAITASGPIVQATAGTGFRYVHDAEPLNVVLGQDTALDMSGLRFHISALLAELIPHNRSTANHV